MIFTDTHTHLYLDAFKEDRHSVIQNAIDQGISYMLLPNIDSGSVKPMMELCDSFPNNCFPMMGLHPTSVKENYLEELNKVEEQFAQRDFIAVGEIGIDLYWDKTFHKQQEEVFRFQINLALEKNIPIVIHSRDSFDEIFSVLKDYKGKNLRGVFHCFTGTIEQAHKAIDMGFYLGIGGVVTFKNSGLDKIVEKVNLVHLLLETDAPFLAPMPYRGKRNESAYINIIATKIAGLKNTDKETVASITTSNAIKLFKFINA